MPKPLLGSGGTVHQARAVQVYVCTNAPAGLILHYDAETARPSRRLLETPHAGFFFTYNNNAARRIR